MLCVVCFQTSFFRCLFPQRCKRLIWILVWHKAQRKQRHRARLALRGPEGHTAERLSKAAQLVSEMEKRSRDVGVRSLRLWQENGAMETMQELREFRRKTRGHLRWPASAGGRCWRSSMAQSLSSAESGYSHQAYSTRR